MEELSALPSRKQNSRIRTVSLDIPHRFPSPSSTRPDSPLRHRVLSSALPPNSREILAPKPQRHLLDNSASQLWLHTPPPSSPTSSRAASPVSASSPLHGHRFHSTTASFSSLHNRHEDFSPGAVPRLSNTRPKHLERRHGDAGFGRRWIHWMHNNGLKPLVIPGAILASILVKFCIGIGSYSGRVRVL